VPSAEDIDYEPLQSRPDPATLRSDRLTSAHAFRRSAGQLRAAGYVYSAKCRRSVRSDLVSLDRLLGLYFAGRFGFFGMQHACLRSVRGRWPCSWPKWGWKTGGTLGPAIASGFIGSLQGP